MALTPFEWFLVVALFALLGWALRHILHIRTKSESERIAGRDRIEDERAERFLRQQESLEDTVRELIGVVGDLKTWVLLEFVRRPDHDREIAQVKADIRDHAKHFQRELESLRP